MHTVTQIACGWSYCMILTQTHEVYTWGDNIAGNLGTADTKSRQQPTLVLLDYGKPFYARYIDCYSLHSAGISLDGKLYAWGQGQTGQLGNNLTSNVAVPTKIKGVLDAKNIIQVSCGAFHTACITNDGFCYTWGKLFLTLKFKRNYKNQILKKFLQYLYFQLQTGSNANGQLGLDESLKVLLEPFQVQRLQSHFIVQVTCGYNTSFFFSQIGRLYACGSNQTNKLGLDYHTYYKKPKNLYFPIELNNSFLKGVSFSKIHDLYIYQIVQSMHSTFALSSKGYLTSWGLNIEGTLGRNVKSNSQDQLFNLDADFDDKIEGYNPKRYENIMIPNRVQMDHLGFLQQVFFPIQNQQIYKAKKKDFISSEFVDIKVGVFHCMGLTNAGEVYIWGSNTLHQHGCDETWFQQTYNDQNASKIKINVTNLIGETLPTLVNFFDINENRRVSYIACGNEYCMAIENRRKVFGWGRNESGQLGIGMTSPVVPKPTEVSGLEGLLMKQISCGSQHTLFLSDEGEVYACGSPTDGRLGLGERDAIQLFPMKIQGLSRIDKVACGQTHSLALGDDILLNDDSSDMECIDSFNKKVIYSWGNAFESKLGHGEKENIFEPTRIQANNHFIDVFAGYHHSAAIDKEHNFIVWGPYQYFGYQKPEEKNPKNKRQEGNEFTRPTIHPKQQMLQQVYTAALGDKYSIVLNSINQVFQWGVFDKQYENKAQENLNITRSALNESLLTNVSKLNTPSPQITRIEVSSNHAALISKKQVYTWGNDMYTGRLAHGYEFYDQQYLKILRQ